MANNGLSRYSGQILDDKSMQGLQIELKQMTNRLYCQSSLSSSFKVYDGMGGGDLGSCAAALRGCATDHHLMPDRSCTRLPATRGHTRTPRASVQAIRCETSQGWFS